jgi:hypothetical protein
MINLLSRFVLGSIVNAPLVVVMIGSDSVSGKESAKSIYMKIIDLVELIRSKWVVSPKILLLSILPKKGPAFMNSAIAFINTRLNKKYQNYQLVKFLDISEMFFASSLTKDLSESMYSADKSKLSVEGYSTVINAIKLHVMDVIKLEDNFVPKRPCDMSILDTLAIETANATFKESRPFTPMVINDQDQDVSAIKEGVHSNAEYNSPRNEGSIESADKSTDHESASLVELSSSAPPLPLPPPSVDVPSYVHANITEQVSH